MVLKDMFSGHLARFGCQTIMINCQHLQLKEYNFINLLNMKKLLILFYLTCTLPIFGAKNDNNIYRSLRNFLSSEDLPSDSSTLKDSSIYVEELLIGGNDFSKPFGVYLFNKKGNFDTSDYLLIKENNSYVIYKENNILSIVYHLLSINEKCPKLLCDKSCFEYIKKISALKEPLLRVGEKRGPFIFINNH